MTNIALGKQYRTKDGREVRIYAVDGCMGTPIHGAINTDGKWHVAVWTNAGHYYEDGDISDSDLIEVRPRIKREMWCNLYIGHVSTHDTKAIADHYGANSGRLACVRVTIDCEEGEGL